jgi:hypothetical protein
MRASVKPPNQPNIPKVRQNLHSAALALAIAAFCAWVPSATAQYTVTDLNGFGFLHTEGWGISGGHQVGDSGPFQGGPLPHALLWSGTAGSVVDLNPSGFFESEGQGISGGQQVGYGYPMPSYQGHALLWSGTADSVVDLHPGGFDRSYAFGTSGSQQVGYGITPQFTQHALLWSGTAGSAVDLHPAGFTHSQALGISGSQQVGYGDGHALLWSGTADSVVDLNPSGFTSSHANGISGSQQVGYGDGHALLWSGTADSVVDLHNFLPAGYSSSIAQAIDANGNIFGVALSGGQYHAILWTFVQSINIMMLRCESNAYANPDPNAGIDTPLIPVSDVTVLAVQTPISGGLVADGVTPLLLKIDFNPGTAPPGQYDVTFDPPTGGDFIFYTILSHLRVLQNGVFTPASNFTFDGSSPVYAMISGINAEDFLLNSGSTEMSITVHVTNHTNPSVTRAVTFRIRKPPIVLVHGFNVTDPTISWTPDYRQALAYTRPPEFIQAIHYGTGISSHPSNTFGRFDQLAPDLDDVLATQIEDKQTGPFRAWAFTRYDIVAHSQGGVLVRMLCTNLAGNPRFSTRAFRNADNANRGRFRRIVTIGSPHNGSLLLYYLLDARVRSPEFF